MTDLINNAIKNYYTDPNISTTLQSATDLILNERYSKFNNKLYKENKGVPLGSPISNVIAEWKLRNLDTKILNEHKTEFRLWLRHVDNIFIITSKRNNL